MSQGSEQLVVSVADLLCRWGYVTKDELQGFERMEVRQEVAERILSSANDDLVSLFEEAECRDKRVQLSVLRDALSYIDKYRRAGAECLEGGAKALRLGNALMPAAAR